MIFVNCRSGGSTTESGPSRYFFAWRVVSFAPLLLVQPPLPSLPLTLASPHLTSLCPVASSRLERSTSSEHTSSLRTLHSPDLALVQRHRSPLRTSEASSSTGGGKRQSFHYPLDHLSSFRKSELVIRSPDFSQGRLPAPSLQVFRSGLH